jgi:hypothetical protein
MATLILQAAGAFLGGFLGTTGAAVLGAAGSMAGYLIDRALINSTLHRQGPRLEAMRPFTGEEGAAMARVWGAARVSGTLIWATRFEEASHTERDGFKGGARTTTYTYFANAAFGLCEGEIAGIRRVWADGREVDLSEVEIRVFRGGELQMPDTLIEAKQGEGAAPAYRGTAYAVLERFPIGDYGNRIPQLQFEVLRPIGGFGEKLKAVALIPGATMHGLATERVTRTIRRGETETVNRHVLFGETDLDASLDELAMLCPDLKHVALVVTWFGDDLRAGACSIYPAVTATDTALVGTGWSVNGVSTGAARIVSQHDGGAAYGGTPSDRSVVQAIAAIKARGWSVTLYPFVMMDVPASNGLPDPHGGTDQAAYPWRGRISCFPGPGQPGSADVTAAARAQIVAFCGAAGAGDFAAAADTVSFTGDPGDWGYRRMVLHYAHLAELAGGVDAFLIGSELRGLTTLRDGANAFPFVEQLVDLAAEVRSVLRPATKITYGADWSEYFGHHPAGGDVFFHLDPLWASDAIDAVGIDNYMPLSDWRDEDCAGGNPDGFASPYDREGLRRSISSGEGFDWFYADAEARRARARTPIADGMAGKDWVYRHKDLKAWWANEHLDRVGGVESATPTAWVPQSKPLWLTELGCAAVDKGPNQPNVFPDPKSSENALPYFSHGGRSDLAQRRFLEAHLAHWTPGGDGFDEADNPVSDVYGGRMLDPERIYAWAWDARPFPAFPLDRDSWSDGENWLAGHWLNGRLGSVDIADLIEALCAACGLEVEARGADGMVAGYVLAQVGTARDALSPLVELFDLAFDASGDAPRFATIGASAEAALAIDDPVSAGEGRPAIELVRPPDLDLPTEALLGFGDPLDDYQSGSGRAVRDAGQNVASLDLPGAMEAGQAEALAADWLRRAWTGRETARFAVPARQRTPRPGSLVALPGRADGEFVVSAIEEGLMRQIEARRIVRLPPAPDRARLPPQRAATAAQTGAPLALFLDLPMAGGEAVHQRFKIAAYAKPWVSQQVYCSPAETGFELRATLTHRATVGELADPLPPGAEGGLDEFGEIVVGLYAGALASVPLAQMLNGANVLAVRSTAASWEIVQFAEADEIEPGVWRLTRLLRGQLGTGDAAAAGAAAGADVVLLDSAVQAAGLREGETGLELVWRVAPAGRDFGEDHTVTETHAGGVRAALPLSPVHLTATRQADGAFAFAWIRRGRIDADSWQGVEIPDDEPFESYVLRIGAPGGATVRQVTVGEPSWTYAAASLAADSPALPDELELELRQVGRAGEGIAARLVFATAG